MFLFCGENKQNGIELLLFEDPKTKPIIYPIAEGSALCSRVRLGNGLGDPTLVKVSDEMRVCGFTEFHTIYVHSLKEDKLIVKVSEVGVWPVLLHCLPSSDKISLEITFQTDIN